MQLLVFAFLAIGLACVSPSGPSKQTPAEHPGFTFPASIGELHLENLRKFDDPLYGAVANYRLAPTDPMLTDPACSAASDYAVANEMHHQLQPPVSRAGAEQIERQLSVPPLATHKSINVDPCRADMT